MTTIQYALYATTVLYVAEFVQPSMPLNTPQPPPPSNSGLQHF
jgi:hypothetical protein